jgi:hypothetical protein
MRLAWRRDSYLLAVLLGESVSEGNLDTGVSRSKDYSCMKGITDFPLRLVLCLPAVLMTAGTLCGQTPDTYQITPDKTTMLIGESRTFPMVDQTGRAQTHVTWTLSDVDAFESTVGDQVQLIPKRAGEFRLTARTDFATAEGSVKVVEGSTLPPGTVKWTSGAKGGCKTVKVLPVFPQPNGPAMFQQTICEDGEYVAASGDSFI